MSIYPDRWHGEVAQIVYDWMAERGIDDLIGDREVADDAIDDLTEEIMKWVRLE